MLSHQIVQIMRKADSYFDLDRQQSQLVWDAFNVIPVYERLLIAMIMETISDEGLQVEMIFKVSKACQSLRVELCNEAQRMDLVAVRRFYERQESLNYIRNLQSEIDKFNMEDPNNE